MRRFALSAGPQTFALSPGVYRVGRAPASEIRLDDASVSRSHATLRVDGERVLLEERGSRNGIRVNGVPRRGSIVLSEGDRIQIGTVELTLVVQEPALGDPGMVATRPLPRVPRLSEPPAHTALSARERQVLGEIASGVTQREIAERLGVSVKTVETYRARIADKLGLSSRAEFVAYAVRVGALTVRARGTPAEPTERPRESD